MLLKLPLPVSLKMLVVSLATMATISATVDTALLLKLFFGLTITTTLVFGLSNYRVRLENLKVFEKGNVPFVPSKNIFSGNLHDIIVNPYNVNIINDYHKKLGPIFGTQYGNDPWVYTVDLELIQRVFIQEGNKHVDINQYKVPLATEIDKSLAQMRGDDWRSLRRILNPTFSPKNMKSDNVLRDVDNTVRRILDCIAAHPMESIDENGKLVEAREVNVIETFKKYSLDVIFNIAFGIENHVNMEPKGEEPLISTINHGSKLVSSPAVWFSIMFPSVQRLMGFLIKFTSLGQAVRKIHKSLGQALSVRNHMVRDKSNRKMVDTIIDVHAANKLSDEMLTANLFFMLVAGYETTANTMVIFSWLMARHPDVQAKLRSEILIEGAESNYLNLCIKECMRLYPVVPTGVGRILEDDIQHKDMTFYKGTSIVVSTYSLHRMKGYWGEDAHLFRPERFAELNLHPAQFFAFGVGPRRCLGYDLALMELRLLSAAILAKYSIEICQSTPDKIDFISPNLIHIIIEGSVNLKFVELS